MTMHSNLRSLRLLAFAEGISLLLLVGIAVPLKHLLGHSVAVRVVGPLHGIAFLGYVVCVVDALATRQLTRPQAGLALVASFIPGGTFIVMRLASQQRGPASTATNHDRDVVAPRPPLNEMTDIVRTKNVDERTQ